MPRLRPGGNHRLHGLRLSALAYPAVSGKTSLQTESPTMKSSKTHKHTPSAEEKRAVLDAVFSPLEPVVSREAILAAEAALMKAANEFGKGWGCDPREHPRIHWLELHLERWANLARSALEYSECYRSSGVTQQPKSKP